MASQQKNVGILAIEIYFPPTCVQQVNKSNLQEQILAAVVGIISISCSTLGFAISRSKDLIHFSKLIVNYLRIYEHEAQIYS